MAWELRMKHQEILQPGFPSARPADLPDGWSWAVRFDCVHQAGRHGQAKREGGRWNGRVNPLAPARAASQIPGSHSRRFRNAELLLHQMRTEVLRMNQPRAPSPSEFLRYYFGHRYRRLVLPLHSLELMSTLAVLAVAWPQAALLGYLLGALLHLAPDVLVNG